MVKPDQEKPIPCKVSRNWQLGICLIEASPTSKIIRGTLLLRSLCTKFTEGSFTIYWTIMSNSRSSKISPRRFRFKGLKSNLCNLRKKYWTWSASEIRSGQHTPPRLMIHRQEVTPYVRSRSTKKAPNVPANSFWWIWQEVKELRIAKVTTKRGNRRAQKLIRVS